MNKKIVFIISCAVLMGMSGLAFAETIQLPNPLCDPNRPAGSPCIDSFTTLIAAVTTFIMTYVIGGLAVLMFVWAGILFVTSGGDPGKIDKAKHALTWAVIGTIVAFAGTGLILVVKSVIGVQ